MAASKDRSVKKGLLTREIHNAERFLDSCDVEELKTLIPIINSAFDKFDNSHTKYSDTLDDSEDIERAITYYDDVCINYRTSLKQFSNFISNPSPDKSDTSKSQEMTSSLVQALSLPRIEIMKIDGNPREYMTFMSVFKEAVESVTQDGSKRLSQLLFHTTGAAHDAVKSCIGVGSTEGYDRAITKLNYRFGSSYVISESIISDLTNYRDVSTAADLRQFSDSLSNADVLLSQLNKLPEVDTQKFILSVCTKLRPPLQYKWRKRVAGHLKSKHCYPSFKDFVAFVEKQSDIVNDPIYGGDVLGRTPRKFQKSNPSLPFKDRSSNFITSSQNICSFCKGTHKLYSCDVFKSKHVNDRIRYVSDNKLCSVCLSPAHITDDCTTNYVCSVKGCNVKHSRVLHVYDNPVSVSNNVNVNNSVLMPIIPVIVNCIYHTHTLLDTGSSDTFCSKDLAYAIGGKGSTTTYTLNTLNATEDVTSEIVQFSLSSEYNTKTFNMNNVRVIKQIPTRGISCDISHYPHLRGITCPGDVQVDILIGQDNPTIIQPLDVRTGKYNEPFAVRGVPGWTLNGPVHSQRPSKRVMNNFVSTISSEKLDSLYKLDHFDDDLHIPPEDDQVMTLCIQRGKVTDGHIELTIQWNNDAKILPDNKYIPESRLRNLLKLLTKRNIFDRYDVEMKKLLHNGYTELIPQ